MVSNRCMGNTFESDFCEMLSAKGFWCHNLKQNVSGQPADVIAVKDGKAFLIDCKVCEKDAFPLSRIESNQKTAMTYWRLCGNGNGWFALKTSQGVYMIEYDENFIYFKKKSMSLDDIKAYGTPLERWRM